MEAQSHFFQAEIKQLLNILIHSLYQDREIFLRELISNASDALNRIQFEMLTNRDVLDGGAELEITITPDVDNQTITISDTGIGMTAEEMIEGLGIIARSGAKSFLEKLSENGDSTITTDIIGQFGVGFYSVFMVADRVEVTSRSFDPEAEAAMWVSNGEDGYEIHPAEKEARGTDITIYLREDAHEFAQPHRIRSIVKRHSDYVNFPIYLAQYGENDELEYDVINQQIAIWRRNPNEVEDEDYNNFYQSLAFDFTEPLIHIHTRSDAPMQFYALLYLPGTSQGSIMPQRTEPGLKLYARKVLIQEYSKDLLPEYLNFVHGVVDSEDLPLNVSRETIQDNPIITKLRGVLTKRVLSDLADLAENDLDTYTTFWNEFRGFIKQGVISAYEDQDKLVPLLRFYSSKSEDRLVSLSEYVSNFVKGQESIYYVVSDDDSSASRSVHLDPFRARDIEVLYLTDTIDGFVFPALMNFQGHEFIAVDSDDLDLDGIGQKPEPQDESEALPEEAAASLLDRIKQFLGDAVEDVRTSKVLSANSPARLVAPKGALDRHQQRLYRMLDREFDVPAYILEVNPRHPILVGLSARLEANPDDPTVDRAVNLLYQSALLADGLHPDPSEMVADVHAILQQAIEED